MQKLVTVAICLWFIPAWPKGNELSLTRKNFSSILCANEIHRPIPKPILSGMREGFEGYVPLSWIVGPGQARYSYDVALEKIGGRSTLSPKEVRRILQYDEGRSPYSQADEFEVAITDYGLVMTWEGHNHFLGALVIGALTVPIKIVRDYRGLSRQQVLQAMQTEGLTFFLDLNGDFYQPQFFCQMIQDDYRYLASQLMAVAKVKQGFIKLKRSNFAYPLAVKFIGDVHHTRFYEFKLGDALRAAGVRYNAESMGSNLSPRFIENARAKLVRYVSRHPELKSLSIVRKKTAVSGLDLTKALRKYVQRQFGCAQLFTQSVIGWDSLGANSL